MTNDYEGGDSATFKTASVMGWASQTEIILLVFYIVTVLELCRRFPPICLQVNDLFEIVILPGSGWAMLFQSPWLHSKVHDFTPTSHSFSECWTDCWGMASAIFEGTSLVNMFVKDCWVNGIRRLIISQRGEEEEFYEIRTEWSDRNVLYLHRSYSDFGRLFKRLVESFPEDRRALSKSPLIEGWYSVHHATGHWV